MQGGCVGVRLEMGQARFESRIATAAGKSGRYNGCPAAILNLGRFGQIFL